MAVSGTVRREGLGPTVQHAIRHQMLASVRVPQVGSVPTGRNQYVPIPAEGDIARSALMPLERVAQSAGGGVPQVNQRVIHTRNGQNSLPRVPGQLAQT